MDAIPIEELWEKQGFVIPNTVQDFYTRKIDFDDIYLMFKHTSPISGDCFFIEYQEETEIIYESTVMAFHLCHDIPHLSIDSFLMICSQFDIKLSFSEHALALMQVQFPI